MAPWHNQLPLTEEYMISECTIFAAVVESQVGGSIHM